MSTVFDALHLQAALLDITATQHATPALVLQRQQQRLSNLLECARTESAFYRARLPRGRGGSASLLRMAPVTRSELMAQFSDWVTDPAIDLDELRAFTADPSRVGEPWRDRYMVWESSGTSGQPAVFVQDAPALAVYDALELVRHRVPGRGPGLGAFGGFSPMEAYGALGMTDRTALVTATGGHFASMVAFERLRRINPWLTASARGISLMQPLPELVAALNDFNPTVLATYPTAAALLAEEAEAGRLTIRPRFVVTGGEALTPAMRSRAGQAFGGQVRGSYGASEFLPMAWECAHGHLHVNEDWVILEPVDEKHRPLPPGQPSHSVLLTNLANRVQPLIRYDLGDQVTLLPGRCSCGSPLVRIELRGRRDDTLRVKSRRAGQLVSLLPMALTTVIEEEGGVFDFQLQQRDASTLVLRVPLKGKAGDAAVERCRTALQAFATAQGAAPLRVLGETGCELPRGRSGKACRLMVE